MAWESAVLSEDQSDVEAYRCEDKNESETLRDRS
jgi:hypothetical protein